MNKVILIGNLTRDPELSVTSGGISLCKFTIAVSRNFTNANGEKETDFINIIAWRALADTCAKYLKKGSKTAVCGSLQISPYDDKNGEKRYRSDVVISDMTFLPSGNREAPDPSAQPQNTSKKSVSELKPIEDEGLPF